MRALGWNKFEGSGFNFHTVEVSLRIEFRTHLPILLYVRQAVRGCGHLLLTQWTYLKLELSGSLYQPGHYQVRSAEASNNQCFILYYLYLHSPWSDAKTTVAGFVHEDVWIWLLRVHNDGGSELRRWQTKRVEDNNISSHITVKEGGCEN